MMIIYDDGDLIMYAIFMLKQCRTYILQHRIYIYWNLRLKGVSELIRQKMHYTRTFLYN